MRVETTLGNTIEENKKEKQYFKLKLFNPSITNF